MERLTRVFEEDNQKYVCIDVCGKKCTEGYDVCHDCKPFTEVMKKLAEYEDLEEQGLLLKLPCEVEEKLYCVFSPPHPANPSDKGKWFMGEFEVARFHYGIKGLSIEMYGYGIIKESEIGKTVFLTKEEAEEKLKEMGNE